MNDKYIKAKKRVEALKGFYKHLAFYLILTDSLLVEEFIKILLMEILF